MTTKAETLPWGWTWADVAEFTRMSTRLATGWVSGYGSPEDIWEACYDGVLDALYAAEEAPRRGWVISYAANRARRRFQTELRQHGISTTGSTAGVMPSFVKYWDHRQTTPSPEGPIVERLGFNQAWAGLAPEHKETLIDAAHRTAPELAKLWRVDRKTALKRVRQAYAEFDTLLHGEPLLREYTRRGRGRRQ